MQHHLIDDRFPGLFVRPGTIEDTTAITHLSTSDLPPSEGAFAAAQLIVAERLAVEPGDDYFTIVAEQTTTHQIVGWLAGGGCRGQDCKGWGELYALSSKIDEHSRLVDEALVIVGLQALRLAQFCGATTWLERDDERRRQLLVDFGFRTDRLEITSDADVPPHLARYSLSFAD